MPFAGEFPRSAAVRRIEVAAPGFRPFHKLVAFDQNHRIEVSLEPLAQWGARRGRAARVEREQPGAVLSAASQPAASPAAQAPSPDLAPGSDLALKRRVRRTEIDLTDPYAR
jgi:hypothetical protein